MQSLNFCILQLVGYKLYEKAAHCNIIYSVRRKLAVCSAKSHLSVWYDMVSNVPPLRISSRQVDKTWQFHSPKQQMVGWMKTQNGKLVKKDKEGELGAGNQRKIRCIKLFMTI